MKKVITCIAICIFSIQIFAQVPLAPLKIGLTNNNTIQNYKEQFHKSNKITGTGGTRWYSFYDYMFQYDNSYWQQVATMIWFYDNELYSTANCTLTDTLWGQSYAMTFDPTFDNNYGGFNDSNLYPGLIAITPLNAYTIDSVAIYGVYLRATTLSTSIVDTLRLSFIYGKGTGTNLPLDYLSSSFYVPYYGIDTLEYCQIVYDSVNQICVSTSSSNPQVVIKDIYLTAADTGGSINLKRFATAIDSFYVPAGQVTAMTLTFKSGYNISPWDTLNHCDTVFNLLPKYSLFLPGFDMGPGSIPTAFPPYFQGYYNTAYINPSPAVLNNQYYLPLYITCNPTRTYNFPLIDWHVNCTNCDFTNSYRGNSGIKNVSNASNLHIYPNPSSGSFTISGTLDNSQETTIEIFNALGQKVYAQITLLQSNKLDQQLNLHLPPGVYTLQIRDDNNKVSFHRLLIY